MDAADRVWHHKSAAGCRFPFSVLLSFLVYLSPFTSYTVSKIDRKILLPLNGAIDPIWPPAVRFLLVFCWHLYSVSHKFSSYSVLNYLKVDRKWFWPLGDVSDKFWLRHLINGRRFAVNGHCIFSPCLEPFGPITVFLLASNIADTRCRSLGGATYPVKSAPPLDLWTTICLSGLLTVFINLLRSEVM
jgi:hypothetical protein